MAMRHIPIPLSLALVSLSALAQPAGSPYPSYGNPWPVQQGQYNYSQPAQPQQAAAQQQPTYQTPYQTPYQQPGYQPSYQQPGYQSPYQQPGYQPYQQQPGYQNPYYQQQPGWQQPGYGQQQPAAGSQSLRVETTISDTSVLVQENILLRLNIISDNNLKTATPQLPQSAVLAFQRLEGPTTSSRNREIVTEFVYQVTPLRSGKIEIPIIHVTGEMDSTRYGQGANFDAVTDNPITLDVAPAKPESTPWLPVELLTLKAWLPDNTRAVAGQPITLNIEMEALGASGNQLPSLERQLKSDAFHVYRERTDTSSGLNKRGTKIQGKRLESFTLVPQYGGDLQIPELRVAWWDTKTNMAQYASVPLNRIPVSGNPKKGGLFSSEEGSGFSLGATSAAFWIPLSVAFGVIFGYWMAAWIFNRKRKDAPTPAFPLLSESLKRSFAGMAPAFTPLRDRFQAATSCLNPITKLQRTRRRLMLMLPLSVRFWFCVRCVDEEKDPDVWGYTLRFLANKHLSMPPRAPFADIADRIVDFHPKADPVRVHQLIHDLDQSVYGHKELDFEQWKKSFKAEIRPRLGLIRALRKMRSQRPGVRLPELNPAV